MKIFHFLAKENRAKKHKSPQQLNEMLPFDEYGNSNLLLELLLELLLYLFQTWRLSLPKQIKII
jgi:hypothetical protein